MKRRRSEPVQGSMLTLMGMRPAKPDLNHAITSLEEDSEGNITRMVHEPVQDPLDDAEEAAAFEAYYGDYNNG